MSGTINAVRAALIITGTIMFSTLIIVSSRLILIYITDEIVIYCLQTTKNIKASVAQPDKDNIFYLPLFFHGQLAAKLINPADISHNKNQQFFHKTLISVKSISFHPVSHTPPLYIMLWSVRAPSPRAIQKNS